MVFQIAVFGMACRSILFQFHNLISKRIIQDLQIFLYELIIKFQRISILLSPKNPSLILEIPLKMAVTIQLISELGKRENLC